MSYKVGDVIADKYMVTREFDSAGGGTCQWGFAVYKGTEYFVKKFLTPVYPGVKASGSEEKKQKRREQCNQFEAKHKTIQDALSVCGDGGLVVKTVDFFREGNEYGEHYLKVCQKIDTSSFSNQIHTLQEKDRLLVMITAAFALNILHLRGIIHLDLKPENILIQKHDGKHIAKIIDFDSSILEGEPIVSEFLIGDQIYYSPEVATYITTSGEMPPPINKSDIFSLGLIFCQYWTSKFPIFSTSYTYAYEAVLNGEKLKIPEIENNELKPEKTKSRLKGKGTILANRNLIETTKLETPPKNHTEAAVYELISTMLALEPDERPSASEVHQKLKEIQRNCADVKEEPGHNRIKKKRTLESHEVDTKYWYQCHHCTSEGNFFSEDVSQCQVCGSNNISLRKDQVWDWLSELKRKKQTVLVQITGVNRGGVLVNIQGEQGFIPKSHINEREDLRRLIGQSLVTSILEIEPPNDIVLSQREAIFLFQRLARLSNLEQGQLVEGKIVSVRAFGVFVELRGIQALLHIREVSQKFVADLPSLFKVGQLIKALVIDIDEDKGQVSLSTKVLENYPGEMLEMMNVVIAEAETRYQVVLNSKS
ncbi:S1 RNA-binding domain-containing protein [Nostoc punctiforme FACHB-252]|uniref:S1 RNA-binding domain-containing protein n=1 Tax=Nostoc punctiforme FACHB-252 TaxID=1357509 RepID=A0ABR8HK27_NOSPU|nr:S1 RNA-binding domain-containing protein [Nostoc punctiforme]MBD2615878.1 S1 RNA-binding domain-containing protein [Nostoc punctiforme FACHB-252]